ncbi:hypothetical protein BO82DRAFT_21149 [Aspergillus uvarum CBS 121591]|uniref:Uncharacterized protein n=1 Tax=Aspergillus uvarum CBS 121591 TaxID=1448315 RepID=A0A319BQ13_9EURO|nr:hypothetical protein BO82DRAFT_21149 [Aspergillus uvarum CBS 121591]PYH75526.1 hypothetical protein BO82DRAFT_21149 [Aspergillus uvarum CBS 121591]
MYVCMHACMCVCISSGSITVSWHSRGCCGGLVGWCMDDLGVACGLDVPGSTICFPSDSSSRSHARLSEGSVSVWMVTRVVSLSTCRHAV